ncbi:DNA-binding protein [Pedobacter frigiditerrae]|uniref:DNA-binding protein n=1 Tax=Pedobacter frigiditerrae TaxID=2530452 RepID=A0A4R0MMS6_9SPHI|nr:helix-turn-helix domain-containing protein [Pedobacter frigiditerrae]TCC88051.1 DNA-binding protein [Pedobacter frigiditerrae]
MEPDINQKLDALLLLQKKMAQMLERVYRKVKTDEEWMDSTDLKDRLNISISTLYRWRQMNLITAYKIGTKLYYSKKEVNELVERDR